MKKILIVLLAVVVLGLFITQGYAEDLELLSWHWGRYGQTNFVTAEGEVKNISNKPLDDVAVVFSVYDKSGTFITHRSCWIKYQPILPNQISPFNCTVSRNPEMSTAKIEFEARMKKTKILWKGKYNIKKIDAYGSSFPSLD